MSCEGCSIRFPVIQFRKKRKCNDCGLLFCQDCASTKGKLYQCYRCKVFTCVPLNFDDVEKLKLKDLQWFLETKGITIPASDSREKPVLVQWVMSYSQSISAQPQMYTPLYPTLFPQGQSIRGLFGPQGVSSSSSIQVPREEINSSSRVELAQEPKEEKSNTNNAGKYQIIDLESVNSRNHIFELTTMELKVLLTRNFISFRGCCEKSELQEKVCWLWDRQEAAKNKNTIPDENLCKICMEANIDSLLLDCGHMVTCTKCGKLLHDCPICRQIIVRVVRAFRS
ncbi:E3 ubiquitin-protein ligase rififylin [Parasteatoda tepidariorum]|uniref:E3 ubiquitin-protein ligase rififylin n=1 Tax=Parasteatoda tepidariorum TaxID=114398 RepID=UPI00077FC352|nr:E3 ubiquitin-protein ligase rififylin [Parasteatoda tepidariorum]